MNRVLLLTLICTASISSLRGQEKVSLDSLNQLSKTYVCVEKDRFDSLSEIIIDQAKFENQYSQWAYALTLRAYGQICIGNFRESLLFLSKARDLYDLAGDSKGMGKALSYTVHSYSGLSQMDSALYYSNQQVEMAKVTSDTITIATAYLARSGIHTNLSQIDSIIFYAIKGLGILGNVTHDGLRGSLNMTIGNAHYQNEDYSQAANYFTLATKFFNEKSMNIGSIYHNLGSVFTKLNMFDSSFYYFNKTISINKRLNRKHLLAYNYQGLAENYYTMGNCEKSIEYNLLAMAMSEEIGEKRSYAGVLVNITQCYIEVGAFAKAVESAGRAVTMTKVSRPEIWLQVKS
jgi:tetratricopeptide (TPR) repeat protein